MSVYSYNGGPVYGHGYGRRDPSPGRYSDRGDVYGRYSSRIYPAASGRDYRRHDEFARDGYLSDPEAEYGRGRSHRVEYGGGYGRYGDYAHQDHYRDSRGDVVVRNVYLKRPPSPPTPPPQVVYRRLPTPPPREPEIIVKEIRPRTPPTPPARVVYRRLPTPPPHEPPVRVQYIRPRTPPTPPPQIIRKRLPTPPPREPEVIVQHVRPMTPPTPPPRIVVRRMRTPSPPPQEVIVRHVRPRTPPTPPPAIEYVRHPTPPPHDPGVLVREIFPPPPPQMPPMVIYKVQPPAPPPRLAIRAVPNNQQPMLRPIALKSAAMPAIQAPPMMMMPGGQTFGAQQMYVPRGVFNKPIITNTGYSTLKSM